MPILELKNVTKEYQGLLCVNNFCLQVEPCDFIVIYGQIGSGKTTILKLIAGLLRPSKGEVFIDGKFCNKVKSKKRNIAMMFQNFQLFPEKTIRKNLEYGLKLRKYSKKEIKERVDFAAEELDIEHILDKKPDDVSQKELSLACLARVLVRKPKIFLVDEPLSRLNSVDKYEVLNNIIRLHAKIQIPFIYATKDGDDAIWLNITANAKIFQIAAKDVDKLSI